MKSPYISDLEPNQIVHGTFLVNHKDVRQKKSGEPFLQLTLADRTGELDARMFDNAAEVVGIFERDDFIRVKGLYQIFQNRPQLTIHKIVPTPESEVDFADYFPASKRDRMEMFAELESWIAGIGNPHLKALLETIFADQHIASAYRTAPAAKSVHHAWLGGLIEHVLSLCHLAKFAAARYPFIDSDLLLTGVILHDIGKIRELNYMRGFSYSTAGQLLGHIVIGASMVEEKLRGLPDFPPKLRDLVLHMIFSHHGELEFGSPKVPMFAEALLLNQLDTLDAKLECMRATVERDRLVEGVWTGYNGVLERSVLKKAKYLAEPAGDPGPVAAAPQSHNAPPSAQISTAPQHQPAAVTPPPAAATEKPRPTAPPRGAEVSSPFGDKLQQALGRDR